MAGGSVHAAASFNFATVVAKAKALAGKSFQPPKQIPDFLKNISYNDYRDIRFRNKDTLWLAGHGNFQVQFIHPGLYYHHAVPINVIDAHGVHQVQFSPDLFDYGHNKFKDKIPKNLGFAGFRLLYPMNHPDVHDQVIVFAGASYFRAVGKGQVFGLSARGLAVDTGLPSGEEFPFFKEFWLKKPAKNAQSMVVYALLDSQSVTGGYQFTIIPGETTVVKVKSTLFERTKIKQLGIAPLTSMFFYGENTPKPSGQWRPEVHDSDGLLIFSNAGEHIWRPLTDPKKLLISSFGGTPRGFGLLQRDRNFSDYEDLEARYDLRPSAWITPDNDWGQGDVRLVEIPSDKEINDNIVAFWVPDQPPAPGTPMNFNYSIHWLSTDPVDPSDSRVTGTYVGKGDSDDAVRFVVDFEGAKIDKLSADASVEPVISMGDKGKLLQQSVEKNPVTGGWRLSFEVNPPSGQNLELRAFLKKGNNTETGTWSYVLEPQ
jgi:glucans biosynthesis protein